MAEKKSFASQDHLASYADSRFAKSSYPSVERYAACDYKNVLDDSLCDVMAYDGGYVRSHRAKDTCIALSAGAVGCCAVSVYFTFLSPLSFVDSWAFVAAGLAGYVAFAVLGLLHSLFVEKNIIFSGSRCSPSANVGVKAKPKTTGRGTGKESAVEISIATEFLPETRKQYTVSLTLRTRAGATRSMKRQIDIGEYFSEEGTRCKLIAQKWYATLLRWRDEIDEMGNN